VRFTVVDCTARVMMADAVCVPGDPNGASRKYSIAAPIERSPIGAGVASMPS
jgi:hypothetical protein